ncbi:MAG: chemotaxis protein CheB [Syntrophobacteraceae bacterium]
MPEKDKKREKAGKKSLAFKEGAGRGENGDNPAETPEEFEVADKQAVETAGTSRGQTGLEGSSDAKSFPIVGIGASAGGLEALEEFFQNVPPLSGMAYVVVSHTDPMRSSLLPEIIQRRSNIPVVEVKEAMPVEPDTVYLPPSNRDLELEGGCFRLRDQKRGAALQLPIDRFFKSLAYCRGGQACCVILSGMGTDGVQGLRAVKEKGGVTIVQSTASAKYEGMPGSAIGTGLADFVLAPALMPERIIDCFSAGCELPKPEDTEASEDVSSTLSKIITAITNRKGHDFSVYKKSTLVRRIQRRMAVARVRGAQQYLNYLYRNPIEIDALFQDLLIGVTSFFRDPEAHGFFQKGVLPGLLKRDSEHEPFRVWAAGCASGEEVYSIVIMIVECLDELGIRKEVQVFGTDLDPSAIEKARNGRYPENIADAVTPQRLERFFKKERSGFEVRRILREPVVFAAHNVLKDPPFSRLDLLVCRNLLIYLEPKAQKKILPLFHYALKPDGVLFLGTSETVGDFADHFLPVSKKWSIYRRVDLRATLQPIVELPTRGKTPAAAAEQPPGQPVIEPNDLTIAEATSRLILEMHSPPCVVVNRRGDISYIHGRTGKYLEHVPGLMSVNVVEMAREGLRFELASALRNVVVDGRTVRKDGLRVKINGTFQDFNLIVKLLGTPESIKNMVVIIFEEIPNSQKPRRRKSSAHDAITERTIELEREIVRLQQDHRIAMEELETSNEELKSVNEELQSFNEELQTTNEELESSREELQSLNEELHTVNAELHEKILEVFHSYEIINRVLNATGVAILFVDRDLNVLRFTREATNLINLIEADIGRCLTNISTNLDYDDFFDDIRKAIILSKAVERQVSTWEGRRYWTKIVPYKDPGGQMSGAVVTFTDTGVSLETR